MNFLCSVSNQFPENYEIGQRAGVWGVEEKYENNIRRTSVGDHVAFMVGGEFRSIHRVASPVYRDETPLWPAKNGDLFPFRIGISEPLYRGAAPVAGLASRISFMKDTQKWQGTVQGGNGVFNSRLTDEDLTLIRDALRPYSAPAARPRVVAERPESRVSLKIFEQQLEAALGQLLDELGLARARADEGTDEVQRYGGSSGFTLLARDRASNALVVLVMDTGEGSPGLILQVLRQISALRQRSQKGREIRGLILTDRVRGDLRLVANEVPNLDVRAYRMRFELDPEPEAGNSGWHAA